MKHYFIQYLSMTMERRTVLERIGGVAAAAALAGCSVQEQGSTGGTASGGGSGDGSSQGADGTASGSSGGTATAWYQLQDSELPARQDAIASFGEQTEYAIEGSDISKMENKTTSAIPAGQGPEIFEWAHDWVGDYSQREFVVDQSDELSVSLDQFSDAAASAVQYDGAVVGLPHSAETVTLIYNADIVDEAPETMDDMVAAMEDYHDPDKSQYGLAAPFDPYFTSGWIQAFGGYYFDPEKDPALGIDSDASVEGLQFALDPLRPYMPNDPTYEPQAAAFSEGNAAFAVNGPWYLATLNQNDVNYEVATFPDIDGGQVRPYTGISMWYFASAMSDGGSSAEAARSFVEWFATNEDHQLRLAEEQGSIPVLDSLVGSDELPSTVQTYSQTVSQGVPMPTDPRMNKVWAPVKTALTKCFNGDAEPEQALSTAAEEIRSKWE